VTASAKTMFNGGAPLYASASTPGSSSRDALISETNGQLIGSTAETSRSPNGRLSEAWSATYTGAPESRPSGARWYQGSGSASPRIPTRRLVKMYTVGEASPPS